MPAGRPRGTGAPTALKLLKGTPKARINQDEPQPDDGVPDCPTDNKDVREVWDYTVVQLLKMRTITMADRDALHAYCELVVQHRNAAKLVERDGVIIQGAHGVVRHPAVSVMKEAGTMLKAFARDFGLTPSARSAIRVSDQRVAKTESGPQRLLSG
jgi:P27 family predicted phage terminase small subunit